MRRKFKAFLCCLLALCLCGCTSLMDALFPPPAPPKTSGKAWSLSARDTRIARLATGGTDLVWSYTLEMAFFKRGGDTAAGEYEGRLMVYLETDCYEGGVYTRTPPGLEESPPGRTWLLSAMMTLTVDEAEDEDAPAASLAAYDAQARGNMEVDAHPGDAPLEPAYEDADTGEAAESLPRAALFDCDEYGDPLPGDVDAREARWRSATTPVVWQEGAGDCGWTHVSATAAAVTAAAGFEGQPVYAGSYAPGWEQFLDGWPAGSPDGALPFWVEIAADGAMRVYLPGLAPLEAERPFEGQMVSGSSIATNLPGPPAASDVPDSSLPEEDSSEVDSASDSVSSKPIWPPQPDSVPEGEPPVESAPEEPEPDPLDAALDKYHLPYPPGGTITGPFTDGNSERFVIEGFDYRAAESYARKLKMGGYKKVHSEVTQPSIERYSFVAMNGVAQNVSLSYNNGKTEMLAFNS